MRSSSSRKTSRTQPQLEGLDCYVVKCVMCCNVMLYVCMFLCAIVWKWKWILTEVSSRDEAGSARKRKLPDNFAAWTPECSQRASIAPAGWTSSGLREPHCRKEKFLTHHSCAGSHVNLSGSFTRKILELCVSSLRQSHAIFAVLKKQESC